MDSGKIPDAVRFRAVAREESRTKLLLGVLVAALAVFGLSNLDLPLLGGDYERAAAAALEHVGPGTVTETEVEGFGAGRSVEVRLADGRQVEVKLDKNFVVIGTEVDDDGPKDVDRSGDD